MKRQKKFESRSRRTKKLPPRCRMICKLNQVLRQIQSVRSPPSCLKKGKLYTTSRSNQSLAMRPHSKAALMHHKTKRSCQMTMRAISELSPQKPLNRSKGSITFLYFMVWDYFLLQMLAWIDLCKCRGPFLTLLL